MIHHPFAKMIPASNRFRLAEIFFLFLLFCLAVVHDAAASSELPLLPGTQAEKQFADIGLVIRAIGIKLRASDNEELGPVELAPAVVQELQAHQDAYIGSMPPVYDVVSYFLVPPSPNTFQLQSLLYFADTMGRRSAVRCEVVYVDLGQKLEVQKIRFFSLPPPDPPLVQLFAVPAGITPQQQLQANHSHAELLEWLSLNAMDISGRVKLPQGLHDYTLYAVSMDRLAPGAHLAITLSDIANDLSGTAGGGVDLDFNGFHVAVVGVKINCSNPAGPYIKIVYTPAHEKKQSHIIGVFHSDFTHVQSHTTLGSRDADLDRINVPLCGDNRMFVTALYHACFERNPSAEEIKQQVGRLNSGMSRTQVVRSFLVSPEYGKMNKNGKQFLIDLYQTLLGRSPTDSELNAWPRTWRLVLINDILHSKEHLSLVASCHDEWKQQNDLNGLGEVEEAGLFDFEAGTLKGWTVTGDAFIFQPTYGDNLTARHRGQPLRQQGLYWIGSYEYRPDQNIVAGSVQGDGPQGTMTSPNFVISGPKLSFLIGGGCDLKSERVELLVAGKVVRKATGSCSETMRREWWDVGPWQNREANIRLIDASSHGWGHINFDDLRVTLGTEQQ